jgi:hypothetical protein
MKRFGLHATLLVVALVVLGVASYAIAGGNSRTLRANLSGGQEVPLVVTGATGTLQATLDTEANTLSYTLTYENLESAVAQAHIHIGQPLVNGGITLWLCANTPPITPPTTIPTPPTCPSPSGTVTGVLGPANIAGPASQGIVDSGDAAANLAEWNQLEGVLLSRRTTYANVHTAISPGGEIRGQIRRGNGGSGND